MKPLENKEVINFMRKVKKKKRTEDIEFDTKIHTEY